MSLSVSDFIKKATKNEPITPPTRVNGFEPGDFLGKYRTFEGGYYGVNDPKYGSVGTIHLRPKSLGANPWSVIGGGVFLENFKGTNRYKIDLVISSAASGYCVFRGEFIGEKVVLEHGKLAFGSAFTIDLSFEFLVGSSSSPPGYEVSVSVPAGSYQRPSSGTRDVDSIAVSGGTGKSVSWSGSPLPLKKSGAGWMVQCSSTTPLGQYRITSVTVTAGGKDHVISTPATIDIVSCSSTPPPPPEDPPPPPPPLVPVPIIVDVWGGVQSTSDTVALGDEDGIVQWASTTTVDASGESRTEAEILPNKPITGYLPVPKVFRPIQGKQIKRSVEIADAGAVEKFGRREKRIKFSGVDSWGALQQYSEYALKDAARCVEGTIVIPGNPYIRSGDSIVYDNHEWLVERAAHDLGEWTTALTVRRILTKKEIGGIFVRASESAEKTIIRIIKDATSRVDNAVEGIVTQQIDSQRYLVRIVGKEEELEVMANRALFGDLLVGSSVLIGRGTI